jgi:Cu2+-exporting ATPase
MEAMSHHHHHTMAAAPETPHTHDHGAMIDEYRRRFWTSLILTLPILLLAPPVQQWLGVGDRWVFPGADYLRLVLASTVYFYGGWPFLRGVIEEWRGGNAGMMTLIALAISVAYFYSSAVILGLDGKVFFWELATLIDVMLLGHWIEMRSIMGASGALEALIKLLPSRAHRLGADGELEEVPISALRVGDQVVVKPGEQVPTDGVIRSGKTSVNEAMLTGESRPVAKGPDDEVIGASINGDGAITIEIRKTGKDTYLSQVVDMVRKAQATRSRTQNLADRAAQWLTFIALGAGILTLSAWLLLGQDFEFSLERMVTVMVITCPHALGLAVPLVVAMSTSLAAAGGLLIRDRAAFERARNLQAVVFDKTGTLTEGRFGVSDVLHFADAGENTVLALAASLEQQSEHPIGAAIVAAARERDVALGDVADFRALPGRGATADVDGAEISVVSPGYLAEKDIDVPGKEADKLAAQGKTVVFVLRDEKLIGAIALADIVRKEAHAAIARLKRMGIRCMMLTGDSEAVAQAVADELELDEYFAGVLPHQKAEKIREIKSRGLKVAMVGDGVNDAPALVEADLGVAIGAGTNVAIEAADVVLVRSDPSSVVEIMGLSRATYGKMIQNLLWATGYNAVAIPLAAGVTYGIGFVLSPAFGAALMSVSTVVVAINARLLRVSGRHGRERPDAGT